MWWMENSVQHPPAPPPQNDTLNIWLCCLVQAMHPLFFRHWLMMISVTFSTSSFWFIWMTFCFVPRTYNIIMSEPSSKGFRKINFLLKWRNVNSVSPLCLFWVLFLKQEHTELILKKTRQWQRPTPKDHRQLQQFLKFANFYWRFINNYSQVTAPPHSTHLLP